MKTYMKFIGILFVLAFALIACSSNDENNSNEDSNISDEVEVDEETGFKVLNIYEDENLASFEESEYEQYEADIEMDFDFINTYYLDQDVIIDNTEYDIRGFEWRTGESLWNETGVIAKDRFTAPVHTDEEMYFINDEVSYEVAFQPDAEPEEMDETPYSILNDHNSIDWENGYVIESDTEEKTVDITAFDKSDDSELWSEHFTGIKGTRIVKELDDYLIFQSDLGGVQMYILDKMTGDIVYEEDYYYLDMYQHEDDIYIADDDHIHMIDTSSWEKEEITPISISDYQYEKDYFVHYDNENILALHMYKGILTIDLETNEPHLIIESIYEDGDDRHIDFAHFYHDGSLYLMNDIDGTTQTQLQKDNQEDENVETDVRIVSVVDLTTGEIKAQKTFDYYVNVSNNHFVKGDDDKFVIATRFDGVFELDLSSLE